MVRTGGPLRAYAPSVRSASTSLPGSPGSVPTARRWASTTLASWGLPDTGWAAAQVVSELATNVTLHARSDFTLTVSVEDGCVRVEVRDGSPVALQSRQYGPTSTTGRGLHIVQSLSSDWGVTAHDAGKTVWALLPVEDAQDDGHRSGRRAAGAPVPGAGAAGAAPTGTVALGRAA